MSHRELFEQYVAELAAARSDALAWWDELLALEAKKAGSEEAARQALLLRWPHGPPSHPWVIAVFRKYFLACTRLNEEVEARAPPQDEDIEASEEDWGADDAAEEGEDEGGFWDEEGPIDTGTFLIDLLHGRHEELAEFMQYFAFWPIGFENGQPL